MPPSATFTRAARPLFSTTSAAFQTRQAFARASPFRRQQWSRRWQSTSSGPAGGEPVAEQISWFKRMWDSPIGIKTVHFWAPVMKVRCLRLWLVYLHFFRIANKKLKSHSGPSPWPAPPTSSAPPRSSP